MFTSRAEYRILLRQDNADYRLTSVSHSIGLASDHRFYLTNQKYKNIDFISNFCFSTNVSPSIINPYLESKGSALISESKKISSIATRPELSLSEILTIVPCGTFSHEEIESVEINIKYRGYIDREIENAQKIRRLENHIIPDNFDFLSLQGLSIECRQKLSKYKPKTLSQALNISGVSPSDISVLLVYFGR